MASWFLYLVECRGGSVYTGITTDVARRYAQHVAGTGARYTRAWPPVRLLAYFPYPNRAAASRAEHAMKRLPAARKRVLCADAEAVATHAPGTPQPTGTSGHTISSIGTATAMTSSCTGTPSRQ